MLSVICENGPRASLLSGLIKGFRAQHLCQCRPDRQSTETLNTSLTLFEIKWARTQIPVQKLPAPNVKIQALLAKRCSSKHMRPKRRIEGSPQFVCAQTIHPT